ncbi:hypothetical protein ALI144C_10235 [Actinosynnema sp. ALI-1.44]|uniref:NAD(P)H-binding protein n=1 Tax=Actinosynnema sp. ALI-1.44 TaxID=1933779 RepID=UPI00097C8685|nr:NAD(P)H-binding protein [Actinosynnema sp. ALI-1.44]ONI87007.1 hypothetical protein ALI144C_10235 [Actinosynnema sp. ALI-1.44]
MIVITAPTGNIGRHLLPLLAESVEELRVVVRDPARLPEGVRERAEVITGSHGDADVVDQALACPSFFDNLLEEVDSIRDKGVFSDAAEADRKAPRAAVADIAAVAARLLLDRSWTGVDSVPVLGPEDLSPNDVARIITEQLGRPVRYENEPYDDMRATLIGYGLNADFVQGIVDMKRAKDNGLDAGVTRTPGTASPTTFEQWCAQTLKPAVVG